MADVVLLQLVRSSLPPSAAYGRKLRNTADVLQDGLVSETRTGNTAHAVRAFNAPEITKQLQLSKFEHTALNVNGQ